MKSANTTKVNLKFEKIMVNTKPLPWFIQENL